MIEAQLVTPDLTDLHRFTLDNGLEVAVLPYGDAPLVRVGLQVKGDTRTGDPAGINRMAEYALSIGDKSQENLLAVAGFMSGSDTSISTSGSSANLDALLNKMRWMVEPSNHDWMNTPYRNKQADSWAKGVKSSSRYPDTWSSRYMYETLFTPEHPLGYWNRPEDYMVMKDWDLDLLKEWIYNKWTPSNAELMVVGRVDHTEAEKAIRRYFDSWEYKANGGYEIITSEEADGTKLLSYTLKNSDTPMTIGTMGTKPKAQPERSIFVFDKPTATQTQVSLTCQIDTEDRFKDRARAQVVGDVLSQMAWRKNFVRKQGSPMVQVPTHKSGVVVQVCWRCRHSSKTMPLGLRFKRCWISSRLVLRLT